MKNIRILNLGAGVGSAPLVGLQLEGVIDYDVVLMSDTQDEPKWVYRQCYKQKHEQPDVYSQILQTIARR